MITVHSMVRFVFCSSASADINVLSASCLPLVSDPKLISHIFADAVISDATLGFFDPSWWCSSVASSPVTTTTPSDGWCWLYLMWRAWGPRSIGSTGTVFWYYDRDSFLDCRLVFVMNLDTE